MPASKGSQARIMGVRVVSLHHEMAMMKSSVGISQLTLHNLLLERMMLSQMPSKTISTAAMMLASRGRWIRSEWQKE